jgi:hypothetical protein
MGTWLNMRSSPGHLNVRDGAHRRCEPAVSPSIAVLDDVGDDILVAHRRRSLEVIRVARAIGEQAASERILA